MFQPFFARLSWLAFVAGLALLYQTNCAMGQFPYPTGRLNRQMPIVTGPVNQPAAEPSFYPDAGDYPSGRLSRQMPIWTGSGYSGNYTPSYSYPVEISSGTYTPSYSPNGYVTPFVGSPGWAQPVVATEPMWPKHDATALVEITVPSDAQIWFNGGETTQTGRDRFFVTPPLSKEKKSTYEVRARWKENGKPVERTKELRVQPGQRAFLSFNNQTSGR